MSAELKQQLYELCHQKHMVHKPGHQQVRVIRMLTQVLCQKLCRSEIRQQNGFKKILAGYAHLRKQLMSLGLRVPGNSLEPSA